MRGRGCYTDDLHMPEAAYGVVIRSPYPAAEIRAIDSSALAAVDGFIGIVCGADLTADGYGPLPFMSTIEAPGGGAPKCAALPVLAGAEVRYVGQPVAFVVAESVAKAHDCAELVAIDYHVRDSVTDLERATQGNCAIVERACDNNIAAVYELGDAAHCEAVVAESAHQLSVTVVNNRLIAAAMEPRATLGTYSAADESFTLYCGNQAAHQTRKALAQDVLNIPPERLRIKVMRIGGGFGAKICPYPEDVLVLDAARRFSRPVRWRAERSESFLADYHARDHRATVSIGFDKEFHITALKIDDEANLGAYPTLFAIPIATTTGNRVVNGMYNIPQLSLRCRTVLTNTVPTAPYRGAGRPEAIQRLEYVLDRAAARFGIAADELRRRNLLAAASVPIPVHSGLSYDSGNFPRILERALEVADWKGFSSRQQRSAQNGKLRGRGLACHIDSTSGLSPEESVTVVLSNDGQCEFHSGTQEMGQGLHSTYVALAAAELGIAAAKIEVIQGDTSIVSSGTGSYGSRSLMIGGTAIVAAAEALIEEVLRRGAELLEVDDADVRYRQGIVTSVANAQSLSIGEIASTQTNGRFEVSASASAPFSFPNGCYVCEIEIDCDTGELAIASLSGVDDVGTVINPMLVHGQVHGGLAQGIGQAICEAIRYDHESGQLVSGSFLDYALPRAGDLPFFDAQLDESQPATTNRFGIKGAGESGAVGGPPAVMSAVINALGAKASEGLQMPLSAEKLWLALQAR